MKKKIALLLASVMTLSMVPMNLFAASTNSLVNTQTVVPEKTVFVQLPYDVGNTSSMGLDPTRIKDSATNVSQELGGVTNGSYSVTSGGAIAVVRGTSASARIAASGDVVTDNLKYFVTSPVLRIRLEDGITNGQYFSLSLTNAEWFFRNEEHQENWLNNWVPDSSQNTPALLNYNNEITRGYYSGYSAAQALNRGVNKTYYGGTTASPDYTTNVTTTLTSTGVVGSTGQDAFTNINTEKLYGKTYNDALGSWSRTNVKNTYEDKGGQFTNGGQRADGNNARNGEVPYTLTVSNADPTRATVMFTQSMAPAAGSYLELEIPLVVRATSKDDITVQIGSEISSTVTPQSFKFSTADGTLTTTYVNDPQTARDMFEVDRLIIKESRIGSLKNGSFRLTLRSGFEWGPIANAQAYFEPGLNENANATFAYNTLSNGETDYTVLIVTISNLVKSSAVPGIMYITGLTVYTEDDDSAFEGDIECVIQETATNGAGVSNQTFIIGTRKEWSYNFKLNGDVKTLVNGRYESTDSAALTDASDDYHYVGSKITFEEITTDTWHAGRITEFVLPEWVKVRKLQITDTSNFLVDDNLDINSLLKNSGAGDIDVYDLNANGTYTTNGNVEAFGNHYPNNGKRYNYVTVDGNVIKLNNLTFENNKKASMQFKLWISIESGYEGDVTLTAQGSAIREDVASIVIAKSVNPVMVETKVTDVKVGYQYQQSADVRVIETDAGMLHRGKTLKVSISDQITQDLVFTPGYSVEIESGDLKISAPRTTSNGSATSNTISNDGTGTITLDISSRSTKASTILYSNMQVKVARDVPQSNVSTDNFIGYDVVAWGTAVAENYGNKGYANQRAADMFATAGIGAQYLRVVSAADSSSTLTNVVKVTIGDPVLVVGDTTYRMDTAAYISEASNSTMIPLRFVAVALGINEDNVIWSDPEHSVTILNPNTGVSVKFYIGDSNMIINGNSVPMLSPDGLAVSAEIRDDRSFIPFRALGTAFGIQVSWDEDTKTAIYNADLEIK